jgi:hypothetical protein
VYVGYLNEIREMARGRGKAQIGAEKWLFAGTAEPTAGAEKMRNSIARSGEEME